MAKLDCRFPSAEGADKRVIPGFNFDGLRIYGSSQRGFVTILGWSENHPHTPRGMRLNVPQVRLLVDELDKWLEREYESETGV